MFMVNQQEMTIRGWYGRGKFQNIWFQTEYCMILLGLMRFLFQNSIRKQQCLQKTLRNVSEYEICKFFLLRSLAIREKHVFFPEFLVFFSTKNKGRTANTS